MVVTIAVDSVDSVVTVVGTLLARTVVVTTVVVGTVVVRSSTVNQLRYSKANET